MKRLGNVPYYSLLIYVLVGIAVTLSELPEIGTADKWTYVLFRALSIVPALPLAFVLRRDPFALWANCTAGVLFTIYSMVGHYYVPFSYASYLEVIILYGILFFLPRMAFYGMMLFMSATFLAFWQYTFGNVKYPISPAETRVAVVMVCLIAPIISLIIYHFFTAERGLKEEALRRFSLLGKNATQIIHDIKGSVSTPLVHLENVETALNKGDIEAAKYQARLGRESLLTVTKAVINFNEMTSLSPKDGITSINEVVTSTLHLLKNQLRSVEVTIIGDHLISSDRGLLASVIMNLFVNSIESFKSQRTNNPTITLTITEEQLIFRDNGGGYPPQVLESLRSGNPISTKEAGSGLGLFMIRDNLKSLNAKIHFRTQDEFAEAIIEW